MRESDYIRRIRHLLAPDIYAWKVADRFTAGVPDTWYSNAKGDLWVEYKWAKTLGRSHTPRLSALQRKWLNDRHAEGRNVAVIVGSLGGALIYVDGAWNTKQTVLSNLRTPREIAAWIATRLERTACACSPCSCQTPKPTSSVTSSPSSPPTKDAPTSS